MSVLNSSAMALYVTPVALEGDAAPAIALGEFADYTEIEESASATIEVGVSDDVRNWDTGDGTVWLEIEVGGLWNDPRDLDAEPAWMSDHVNIPIYLSLDCDYDDDGVEAADCGGADCADGDESIVDGEGGSGSCD